MAAKKVSMKSMDNISATVNGTKPEENTVIGRPKLNPFTTEKKITVSIPEDIHYRLRVTAAKSGRPMVEIVCNALNKYLPMKDKL